MNFVKEPVLKTVCLLFILFLPPMAANARTNCEALIAEMDQLQKQYLGKEYDPDEHIDTENATTKVLAFDEIPKTDPCRNRAWVAYVKLSAAQAPFDQDTDAAHMIAKRLSEKSLADAYKQTIDQFPDQCRRRLLNGFVRQIQCIKKWGGEETADKTGKEQVKCVQKYNKDKDYTSCVGRKQSNNSGAKKNNEVACDTPHRKALRDVKDMASKFGHPNYRPHEDAVTLIWSDENAKRSLAGTGSSGGDSDFNGGSRAPASIDGGGDPDRRNRRQNPVESDRNPASVQ